MKNLGPLLFAATIQSLLGELRATLGIDFSRALLVLQRSIPSLGLTFTKCNSSFWLDPSAHQTCHFSRCKWLEFNLDVSNSVARQLVTEASFRTHAQLQEMLCSQKSLGLTTAK